MNLGKNNHRREHFKDLPAEIREAELQLLDRQHRVHVHANNLVRDFKKELTSPAALLLTGELGFILSELTGTPSKEQKKQPAAPAGRNTVKNGSGSPPYAAAITPLKKLMGMPDLTSLPQALPLALIWLMDTFHPEHALKKGSVAESADPSVKTEKGPH